MNQTKAASASDLTGSDPSGHGLLREIIKAVEKFLSGTPNSSSRGVINSVEAARSRGVDDAWKMEMQMVQRTGRGSREWEPHQLKLLKAGKKVPGMIGDHITSVSADITKAADHRNIQFLTKAEHDARHGGNGGTQKPIWEDREIDRTKGGRLPDLATEGARSWPERAGAALEAITNSRTMAIIDATDPTSWADYYHRQQTGFGWFEWNMMSPEDQCAANPRCT